MSEANPCEVLVIGTGAGGASVAAILAEAGRDVLMLEEGSNIPASEAPAGISRSMLSMWRGGGLLITLGSQIAFAEGRCVGGGTEINSAIFQRAPEAVVGAWQDANRLKDFSSAALAPYYDRAAKAVNASLTPGELGPPTDILARAGAAMGWKVSPLERGQERCAGTNLCTAACPTGAKQSMTQTMIPRALKAGARLMANARVTRLTGSATRVTGALLRTEGGPVKIKAQQVFVCAGTTGTPSHLAPSGMMGAREFQLHPTIRLLARFREPVNAQNYRLPLVAITEFMPDLRFGGSVFTLPTYGMAIGEDWQRRQAWLPDYAHHAIYYAMIKPDGVGRIRTLPGADEPLVTYALTERDRRRLWHGARLLARALFAAGAEFVTPSAIGHPGWSDADAAMRDAAQPAPGRTALMTIHLFASCPMGETEFQPVDSFGRLKGWDNVILADGSVLPGAPGVNPQGTIMALALRAADAFLAGGQA
jgi:choline dehydrogenase-like flavoprotein